jgi:hypothetical protein
MIYIHLLKWRIIILILVVLVGGGNYVTCVLAQENIWYITVTGSDTIGDGSESRPFATIQHGIDVAANGDIVLVYPGVYKENIDFVGKNITVGSLFITTGDEDYILQTVIDGTRSGHVVTFDSGETVAAILSGLTIINGYANGTTPPAFRGGGIFCQSSSPTLTHLKVSGNEAAEEGGGLYFENCSSIIRDVNVTNNQARGGGGMRFSYGSPHLENVAL